MLRSLICACLAHSLFTAEQKFFFHFPLILTGHAEQEEQSLSGEQAQLSVGSDAFCEEPTSAPPQGCEGGGRAEPLWGELTIPAAHLLHEASCRSPCPPAYPCISVFPTRCEDLAPGTDRCQRWRLGNQFWISVITPAELSGTETAALHRPCSCAGWCCSPPLTGIGGAAQFVCGRV